MIRLSFASAFALLGLLAQAAAQPAQVEVLISFQPAPPRTPGYEIWVEGVRVHASSVNDAAVIPLRECTANTRIQVRPADNRYSWPTLFCANPLTAKVRFIRSAANFWNEDDGSAAVDYAQNVAPVFDAVAAAAAVGDEAALALREALDAEDPATLAELARAAGELAEEMDLALGYRLIALDATFRTAGIDPADSLLRFAKDLGTPILTQEGDAVLAKLAPDWIPPLPVEGASGRTPEITSGTGSYGRFVSVGELMGLAVFDAEGVQVGQLSGFAADAEGSAILDVGGFLGIGSRDVAVSLDALSLGETGVTLPGLTIGELKTLPESDGTLLPINAEVEFRFDG